MADRILFHEDITGKEITSTLLESTRERNNITILEHTTMIDIIENESGCAGIVAKMSDGTLRRCMQSLRFLPAVVLAVCTSTRQISGILPVMRLQSHYVMG